MTRIIAGEAGGRRIRTPSGERTRPTSDRVREALFASVQSWCESWHGLRVLDLYAGSGAVGLEAWSRGAAHVELVEADRATASLIAGNARDLGCTVARVVTSDVARHLARPPAEPFDLVFSDPPYALDEDTLARDLDLLQDWLAPGAMVVLERSRRTPPPRWPDAIEPVRDKRYGDTVLWYGRAADLEPDPPATHQERR